jgi:hypothetical protein
MCFNWNQFTKIQSWKTICMKRITQSNSWDVILSEIHVLNLWTYSALFLNRRSREGVRWWEACAGSGEAQWWVAGAGTQCRLLFKYEFIAWLRILKNWFVTSYLIKKSGVFPKQQWLLRRPSSTAETSTCSRSLGPFELPEINKVSFVRATNYLIF